MRKRIESWLGVFSMYSHFRVVNSEEELRKAILDGYRVSGKFHSYNTSALHYRCAVLGDAFKHCEMHDDGTATIGAACTVEEAMNFLASHGRRLLNAGNHRKQTLVGAIMGGTHGFGREASMIDHVVEFIYFTTSPRIYAAITAVRIRTALQTSFVVKNCVCRLSEVSKFQSTFARAYAVLPFSDKNDPVAFVAIYRKPICGTEAKLSEIKKSTKPISWWRLKLWWWVDGFFPPLRKFVQRGINYLKMPEWETVTSPDDIDALYHPWPTTDGVDDAKFLLWAYKPTYTCFNIAIFCLPINTDELIRFAIEESERLQPGLLRCFIGVRELNDASEFMIAGNYQSPRNAIDFYCSPKDHEKLIELQHKIEARFSVRRHPSKTL